MLEYFAIHNHKLFEKYLKGYLTESERSDFLKRLSKNLAFANEFKVYSGVINFIKNKSERNLLKDTITKVAEGYFNSANISSVCNIINSDNYNFIKVFKITPTTDIIITSMFLNFKPNK